MLMKMTNKIRIRIYSDGRFYVFRPTYKPEDHLAMENHIGAWINAIQEAAENKSKWNNLILWICQKLGK